MAGYLPILSGLPSTAPIQALAGPVGALYTSIQAYRNNQQPTRNLIHAIDIIIAMLVGGVILPLVCPPFVQFEADVGPFMGSEGEAAGVNTSASARVANAYVGYFIFSWAGAAVSYAACAAVHVYWYEHGWLFLTKARLTQLEDALKIPQATIKQVFNTIRTQYDECTAKTAMAAAQKADLEKVLHSMMYDDPAVALQTYNDHVKSLNAVRGVVANTLPQYQLSCLTEGTAAPQQVAAPTNPISTSNPANNGLLMV